MLSLFKCAKWFKEPQLSVIRDTQSLTSRTAVYKSQAVPILVDEGDYAQAQNIINTFEDADLKKVYNIDLAFRQSQSTQLILNEADRNTLQPISEKSIEAGLFARNMLALADGSEALKLIPSEEEAPSNKKAARILNYEVFKPENAYSIFPNPNNGAFKLLSYEANIGERTTLLIKDMSGKTILELQAKSGEKQAEFKCENLAKGNYIVTVLVQGKQVFVSKISIYE